MHNHRDNLSNLEERSELTSRVRNYRRGRILSAESSYSSANDNFVPFRQLPREASVDWALNTGATCPSNELATSLPQETRNLESQSSFPYHGVEGRRHLFQSSVSVGRGTMSPAVIQRNSYQSQLYPPPPPPYHTRPFSGSGGTNMSLFVARSGDPQTASLVRRVVGERDAVLHEYSTVMAERDRVHAEMDSLSAELASAKNTVDELQLVLQTKSAEATRLNMDLLAAKNCYWTLIDSMDDWKNALLDALLSNRNFRNHFPAMEASMDFFRSCIEEQFENFIASNADFGSRRNRSDNNSAFSSLTTQTQSRPLRGNNQMRRRSSFGFTNDEHERSSMDLQETTNQFARSDSESFVAFPSSRASNVAPISLLLERIGNLRQELGNRNAEILQNSSEIDFIKNSLSTYRSENCNLLLQIEKLRLENEDMRSSLISWPKIEFHKNVSSAANEYTLDVDVRFHLRSLFDWSNFGVMFSDITGHLTVIEVKADSNFKSVLKPKMKLRVIDHVPVTSLPEMRSKISRRVKSIHFLFSAKCEIIKTDKWTQTEESAILRQLNTLRTSSCFEPQANYIESSPFTRNSTLRSPLVRNSNDNLTRRRASAAAGLSELHRRRHRSYSPSIDLNWMTNAANPFMSSPSFATEGRRNRTLPRNRTELDWFSKRRSENLRGVDEVVMDLEEPFTHGTVSEENSDRLFEDALLETDEQNNTHLTEMQVIEDLDSYFSSGYEENSINPAESMMTEEITQTFKLPNNTNAKRVSVSHKHVASEPVQTTERSTQVDTSSDRGMCTKEMTDGKRSQKKQQTIRELTWPRMRKNFVNPVKGSELTKATPPAERQDSGSSVTGKFKDSPKSIRLPFGGSGGKKRSSILGFKFSPAASVKSRNSSKCSTSSKCRSPDLSCERSPSHSRRSLSVNYGCKSPSPLELDNCDLRIGSHAATAKTKTVPATRGAVRRAQSLSVEAGGDTVLFDGLDAIPSKRYDSRSTGECAMQSPSNPLREDTVSNTEQERVVTLSRNDLSRGFGFRFCGGNVHGLFVCSVMPSCSHLLHVGDLILEVNDLSVLHATLEELFILLKTNREYEVKLRVKAETKLYKQTQQLQSASNEANFQNLTKDQFYVRVICASDPASGISSQHRGLSLNHGEVLYIKDSVYQGEVGVWHAARVDQRKMELQEDSGLVPSMYYKYLPILKSSSIYKEQSNQKADRTSSLDVISEDNRSSSLGPGANTVRSFRKLFLKRFASSSSFTCLPTSTKAAESSNTDIGISHTDHGDIYEFQRVKYFDEDFRRPIVFVGLFCDQLAKFFVVNYPKRFKYFEFSAGHGKNCELKCDAFCKLTAMGTSSSDVTVEQNRKNDLASICRRLDKGTNLVLYADVTQLEIMGTNNLQPLVFCFDPMKNHKAVKDLYFLLHNGGNLSTKKTKRLIADCQLIELSLKKMNIFYCKLTGTLNEVEGKVVKQSEQFSNFNLFVADDTNREVDEQIRKQMDELVNRN